MALESVCVCALGTRLTTLALTQSYPGAAERWEGRRASERARERGDVFVLLLFTDGVCI